MSDEQIDELLNGLDEFVYNNFFVSILPAEMSNDEKYKVAMRAIVRKWLPAAAVCPEQVRVTKASQKMLWYNRRIGEIFNAVKLEMYPDGSGVYWVDADERWRWVDVGNCEPVAEEA